MQLPPASPNPCNLPPAFLHCCCGSQLLVLQFWFILKLSFLFPLISGLFFTIMLMHLDLVVFYFHSVLLAAYAPEDDTCVWFCEYVSLGPHITCARPPGLSLCPMYVCLCASFHAHIWLIHMLSVSTSIKISLWLSIPSVFPTFQSLFYLLFFSPHICLLFLSSLDPLTSPSTVFF